MPGRRRFPVCSLVVSIELLLVGYLLLVQRLTPPVPAKTIVAAPMQPETSGIPEELTPKEQRRRLIIGEWEDDYQAGREWVLREDGTGTMVVQLSGVPAFLFAPTLTFEQTWRVEGDRIVMAVTSGEPQAKVDIVLRLEGDRSTQEIVEVTDEKFVVIDHKGEQFEWRRVPETDGENSTATIDGNSADE